jgi:Na+/phosphate symporter
MVITCFTLSVSVSIGLLVPFTVRGLVRRENLVPYIIGANITTFVDTLFASLLMKSDECFLVILCQIIVVTLVSLPIVFLCYRPYERLIDGLARTIIGRRLYMVVFVSALLIVPLCLLLIA